MADVGGRSAIRAASEGVNPAAVRPWASATGSEPASARMMTVKNRIIDSTMPEFCSVARMPEATPRSASGTELMIEAVFGDENRPIPTPRRKMIRAKCQ